MATPFSISRRSCTENSLWLLDVPMFRLSVVFLTSLTVVTFKVCVLVCCATVWWFVVQLHDSLLCNCMMICCATVWWFVVQLYDGLLCTCMMVCYAPVWWFVVQLSPSVNKRDLMKLTSHILLILRQWLFLKKWCFNNVLILKQCFSTFRGRFTNSFCGGHYNILR